jgi:hypothetical protein
MYLIKPLLRVVCVNQSWVYTKIIKDLLKEVVEEELLDHREHLQALEDLEFLLLNNNF